MVPGISRTTAPAITVLAKDGGVRRSALSAGAAMWRRAFASTLAANSVVRNEAFLGTPVMRRSASLQRRQRRYASARGCILAGPGGWLRLSVGLAIARPSVTM